MLARLTAWLAGDGAGDLVPSHFGFNVPLSLFVCLALLAITAVATALLYSRRLAALTTPARVAIVALRTAFITIILFLALDPSIVAQRVKPGEQFVILLFDDSQSMRLVGRDGLSRGGRLLKAYEAAKTSFEGYLAARHQLARYRLGASIEPIQRVEDLDFSQRETDLTGGVANAITDLEGTSISAVVLFSDGVQQTTNPPVEPGALPATVPLFTVGVDEAASWSDIELAALSVKRSDFDKSPVVVDIDVHAVGLAGREAEAEVFLGSRLVKSRRFLIGETDQEHTMRIEFVPDRAGWLEYEARVSLLDANPLAEEKANGPRIADDSIQENNARKFVIDNREKTYRILYVSGRPNWENKFVRRALEADDQLKLTSLISISNAEPKFVFRGKRSSMANPLFDGFDEEQDRPRYDETIYLRIGAAESELLGGYPSAEAGLFGYDLVIFGDVESAFFTMAQLELTRDFVEKRGGALLLLGGLNSFTEGKYAGTIIENMLPVTLYQEYDDPAKLRTDEFFQVTPTIEGSLAGPWSFESEYKENRKVWAEMPKLFSLNFFPSTRPGATVMAEAKTNEANPEGQPFFAIQRYGEGTCSVLATSDTWQWQMRLKEDDERHERLWRQIVRSLVHDVPEPTVLRAKQDAYTQGAPALFEFVIRDEVFEKREGLRTNVVLRTPSQVELPLPVDESIREVGLYASRFTPEEAGVHTLTLSALNDKDEVVTTLEEAILVEPDQREFQKAQYDPEFLSALTEATGGRLYTLDELPELARQIPIPPRQDAEEVLLHLWHLPWFYALLVAMMAVEWYLRRKRGEP